MKKVFAIAVIAATSFTACNNAGETETTTTPVETTTETTPVAYTPGEGDIMYTEGAVKVYQNGAWVPAEADVTLENGIVITKEGVVKKDQKTVQLAEGEAVTKVGNFFNRAGEAIEDGWDATKHGVSEAADATKEGIQDAGKAIEKGAEKVGDKAKEVVE